MKRTFKEFISDLKPTISGINYYTNFERVYRNVDEIKIELNILNSLLGSSNINTDFKSLVAKYPEILKCIPILLAVREKELTFTEDESVTSYNFASINQETDKFCSFMEKSGLYELLSKRLIANLVDYVTGVEVGLDSNGRKSRGGVLMHDLVENYISQIPNLEYLREASTSEIRKVLGFDISSKKIEQFKAQKRFDFAIKSSETLFLVEVNFYNSGGSKLNETARSFQELNRVLSNLPNVKFIWITDGRGWNHHKNNLHEAYDSIEFVLSIKDLESERFKEIIQN